MLDTAELEKMLEAMVRSNAVVLHIMSGREPCLRVRQRIVRSHGGVVTAAEVQALVDAILSPEQRAALERGREVDGLYASRSGIRFRSTAILDERGPALVFRRVPTGVPSFDELGLPLTLDSFVRFRSGLVLVAGFLGSGKSMTLAAMVDRVNQTCASHIVTIEQTIRHVHMPASSVVHQREVGRHTADAATGVREAVRQSADVIVIGSLETREDLAAALDAAERGCLVIAGMRASSVADALERLSNGAAEPGRDIDRLVGVLRVALSQALLPRRHGEGSVPLLEILINNQTVAVAIRSRRFEDLPALMERGRGLGMQTADRALKNLFDSNQITSEEALYHAADRDWVCSWAS